MGGAGIDFCPRGDNSGNSKNEIKPPEPLKSEMEEISTWWDNLPLNTQHHILKLFKVFHLCRYRDDVCNPELIQIDYYDKDVIFRKIFSTVPLDELTRALNDLKNQCAERCSSDD